MKYCTKCGNQLADDAVICTNCGCTTAEYKSAASTESAVSAEDGMKLAAKILMVVGTVAMGMYLFPLIWCIPMTLSYWNKVKNGEPGSMGFKICTLLFVNTIAGILMLCVKD